MSIAIWLRLALLYAWIAFGLLSPFFGYAYFQAFVICSVIGATIAAIVMREPWSAVHPVLSVFYWIPALLVTLQILRSWIETGMPLAMLDWGHWLAWSAGLAIFVTAVLFFAFRHRIERKWTAAATAGLSLILFSWLSNVLNVNLPQSARMERAQVVSANTGMVRTRAWSVTIEPVGPFSQRSNHIPGPATWRAAANGEAVCLCVYTGGLGWRWTMLVSCGDS